MMKRRLMTAAMTATALVALLAAPMLAEAARGGKPANIGDILHNARALARYLKLTPAQIVTTKLLLEDLRATTKPIHDQIEPLREQLGDQVDAASPDACAIGNTLLQIRGLRDQIEDARGEFDDAFSAILTPAQLIKYEALKEAAKIGKDEEEDD